MGSKDRRNVILAHVIVIGITDLLFNSCVAIPMFDPEPIYLLFSESTPIGTTLFVLNATDDEDPFNKMIFNADSAMTNEYVNVNQTRILSPATANITLKKELDRESETKSVRLLILDVCDERPKFDDLSYMLEINETNVNTPIVVFTKILALDKDNGYNAIITYSMELTITIKRSEELKKMYREMFTICPFNGSVFLMRSLDYKRINVYQFTVHANKSLHDNLNASCEYSELRILNISFTNKTFAFWNVKLLDTCGLTADPADLIIIVMDVPDATTFFTRLPYTSNEYDKNHSNTQLSQVTAFNGSTISYSTNKYSSLDVPLLASLLPALLVLLIVCIVLGIFTWRRKQNAKMSNTKQNDATGSVKEVAVTESPEAAYESLDDYYMSLDKCKGITPEYDQITHDYINKTGL